MIERSELAIAVVAVMLTALGMAAGAIAFLWRFARYVTRIETSADRVAGIESRLERIPAIEQHLTMQDARLERIERRTDSAHAHAMRAELVSSHDMGDVK